MIVQNVHVHSVLPHSFHCCQVLQALQFKSKDFKSLINLDVLRIQELPFNVWFQLGNQQSSRMNGLQVAPRHLKNTGCVRMDGNDQLATALYGSGRFFMKFLGRRFWKDRFFQTLERLWWQSEAFSYWDCSKRRTWVYWCDQWRASTRHAHYMIYSCWIIRSCWRRDERTESSQCRSPEVDKTRSWLIDRCPNKRSFFPKQDGDTHVRLTFKRDQWKVDARLWKFELINAVEWVKVAWNEMERFWFLKIPELESSG